MSEVTDATAFISTARVDTGAPSPVAGRKRRRKTFSCLECRQRKLKCDNGRPSCSRCQQVGRAGFCTYDSSGAAEARLDQPNATTEPVIEHGFQSGIDIVGVGTGTPPSQPSGPDGSQDATVQSFVQQLEAQNSRIAELEAKLSRMDTRPDSWLARAHNTGSEGTGVRPTGDRLEMEAGSRFELEAANLKGREFETQFYGASHWMSPIINFPDLRVFMKDAVRARSHTLSRLESQLNVLPKQYAREQTFDATDADLVALLPAKQDVDTLIGVYLDNFETCYHILHVPSFWRDYAAFWASRSEFDAAYVVLMLLAIATARCAAPDERYVSIKPITSDPDWAKVRIDQCEAWLQKQSQKHLRSDAFQHHCLLLLAKRVNRIKVKAAWRSSVALVTFAMTTGLHRKYDFLGAKVSVFHQEMRRRFWTTITELELQAAFDRGMTCFTPTTPWDCEKPANINDADITEESQRLPESRPQEDYTDAAFLHASRSSFELRSSLVSLINNPSTRLQPSHVLEYEAKISEELDMIPKWSSLSGEVGVCPRSAMVPQVLLATQLRQLLIAVHTPFAQQTGNDPRSSYSRLQCLNAAGTIIDQQSNLTASGYHGLALLRNDVIRASVCISKNLMLSNSLSNSLIFSTLSQPFYAFVESSLSMLEDSTSRIGSGFKDYWYVSAAAGLLSTMTSHHTDPDFAKQKSVERVIALYRKVFGDQITDGAGGAAPLNEEAWVTTSDVLPVEQMSSQQTLLLPDQLDLEDLTHWTMDDLWSFDLNGGRSFGVGELLY